MQLGLNHTNFEEELEIIREVSYAFNHFNNAHHINHMSMCCTTCKHARPCDPKRAWHVSGQNSPPEPRRLARWKKKVSALYGNIGDVFDTTSKKPKRVFRYVWNEVRISPCLQSFHELLPPSAAVWQMRRAM